MTEPSSRKKENRRTARADNLLAIELVPEGGSPLWATVVDFSRTGLRLSCKLDMAQKILDGVSRKRPILRARMVLPPVNKAPKLIEATIKLVRSRRHGKRYELGAQFVDLPWDAAVALEQFVSEFHEIVKERPPAARAAPKPGGGATARGDESAQNRVVSAAQIRAVMSTRQTPREQQMLLAPCAVETLPQLCETISNIWGTPEGERYLRNLSRLAPQHPKRRELSPPVFEEIEFLAELAIGQRSLIRRYDANDIVHPTACQGGNSR